MTPKEIEERFGKKSLEMLYDCLLQNPVHELADWILAYHTSEQIGSWITQLQEDEDACRYCGGNCLNDEHHACDGYLGDIDGLYSEEKS
jgi:hypothetical protein